MARDDAAELAKHQLDASLASIDALQKIAQKNGYPAATLLAIGMLNSQLGIMAAALVNITRQLDELLAKH